MFQDWCETVSLCSVAKGDRSTAVLQGDRSTASLQGDRSTASLQGDRSTASLQGDRSTASLQGDRSTASLQGDRRTATLLQDLTQDSATLTGWRRTNRSGEGKMITQYCPGIYCLRYRSFP
jgi:hypothetical protein